MKSPSGAYVWILLPLLSLGIARGASSEAAAAYGFTWGGDEQFRPVEHHSRNIWFDPDHASSNDGPPVDCMRWRERVWFGLSPKQGPALFLRLAHRWWHYNSRPGANDEYRSTWRFPDEVVLDSLNLRFNAVAGSPWFVSVGRQDLLEKGKAVFGNGLVLNDGTTLDGGRTCYFDGLLAGFGSGKDRDLLRLGVFYQTWKDHFILINDVNRQLRPGNTGVLSAAWTHRWAQSVAVEASLFDVGVADSVANRQNTRLFVTDLRFFGVLSPTLSYGLEWAHQSGEYRAFVTNGPMQDCTGTLLDARLDLRLSTQPGAASLLKFQYTYFSGDKASTPLRYEGWNPLFTANVPLFREECYYTLNKGAWTDLHHLSCSLEAVLRPGDPKLGNAGRLVLTPGWTSLFTERDTNAGKGRHIGEMPSLFLDWQWSPQIKVSLLGAVLFSGNRYLHRNAGEWLRCEVFFVF